MKRFVLVLAVLVMFVTGAGALTYRETAIKGLGYANFEVEGIETQDCTEV